MVSPQTASLGNLGCHNDQNRLPLSPLKNVTIISNLCYFQLLMAYISVVISTSLFLRNFK